MLIPSRQLDYVADTHQTRILLDQSRQVMLDLTRLLRRLAADIEVSSLQDVLARLEASREAIATEHAQIDVDLLLEASSPWAHPVQAISSPRAPLGALQTVCAQRLEQAEDGEQAEQLRSIYQRVSTAHDIAESARRRRQARAEQIVSALVE